MLITLLDLYNKKERIFIRYNPITGNIYVGLYYEKTKKQFKIHLFRKTWNYEMVDIVYYPTTNNIATYRRYIKDNKSWREQNPNYNYIWTKQHPENMQRKWRKHGNKRKRELNCKEISKNIIDGIVDWHHINNEEIVAIPKYLHKLYYGMKREEHRFMCNQIVAQLYPDCYKFMPD